MKQKKTNAKDLKEIKDTKNRILLGGMLGNIGAVLVQKPLGKILFRGMPSIYNNTKKKRNLKSVDALLEGVPRSSETKNLGKSFIKEHGLQDVKFSRSNRADYYNSITHNVNLAHNDKSVLLHELGHASDIRGSVLKSIARRTPYVLAAGAIPTAMAYGDEISKRIPGTIDDKIINFIANNPILVGLGTYGLSTLYPEGKASYLALKHLMKHKGKDVAMSSLKHRLGPAFGTYLAAGLPIAGGYGLAKVLKKNKDTELKKTAMSETDRKAFMTGFLSIGVPVAAFARHYYGEGSGKVVRNVDHDIRRYDSSVLGSLGDSYSSKIESIQESIAKHPNIAAATLGITAGLLGGALTKDLHSKMDLGKWLKR